MLNQLNQIELRNQKQFRIIPSVFPPIQFFEDLVDPEEMEMLWKIESLTNERVRQEIGDIFLISPEDRISGPGSSVVMAAFTHINKPSRFTNGSFGIYYAGLSLETAIKETVFHRERFLSATQENACEITMRLYKGKILKPLHDIRDQTQFEKFHHSDNYNASQKLGYELRENKSWGIVYNSVRHHGGQCIAVFRPTAISIPAATAHLRYVWNGRRITDVFKVTDSAQSIQSF